MSFQRDSQDDDVDGIAPGPCRAARGTRHERAAAATVVPPPTRASRKAKGNPAKSSPYRRPFISPFRFRTLRECGWPTTRRRTNRPTSIPNKYTARPFGSRAPSLFPPTDSRQAVVFRRRRRVLSELALGCPCSALPRRRTTYAGLKQGTHAPLLSSVVV